MRYSFKKRYDFSVFVLFFFFESLFNCLQAVRMALAKIEDGCSIEDAQAVCEPEVLNQIFKWQVITLNHLQLSPPNYFNKEFVIIYDFVFKGV